MTAHRFSLYFILAAVSLSPLRLTAADTEEELAQIEGQRLLERRTALLPIWQKYSQDLLHLQDSLAARGDFVRARLVAQERSAVLARLESPPPAPTERNIANNTATNPEPSAAPFSGTELRLRADQAETAGDIIRQTSHSSMLLSAALGVRLRWTFPTLSTGRYRLRLHAHCLATQPVQARLVIEGHAPLPLIISPGHRSAETANVIDLGEIQLSTDVRSLRLEMTSSQAAAGRALEVFHLSLQRENPLK
jgi:hypothetical protein